MHSLSLSSSPTVAEPRRLEAWQHTATGEKEPADPSLVREFIVGAVGAEFLGAWLYAGNLPIGSRIVIPGSEA